MLQDLARYHAWLSLSVAGMYLHCHYLGLSHRCPDTRIRLRDLAAYQRRPANLRRGRVLDLTSNCCHCNRMQRSTSWCVRWPIRAIARWSSGISRRHSERCFSYRHSIKRLSRATPGAEASPLERSGSHAHLTRMPRESGGDTNRGKRRATDRPAKVCLRCGRPFTWRRKWARDWAQVRYCSDNCRQGRAASD